MYMLPMTNLVNLTKIIRQFFWEGTGEKKIPSSEIGSGLYTKEKR
jgi:hypothetical protein